MEISACPLERTVKLAGQEYWPSILNQKEKESEGLVFFGGGWLPDICETFFSHFFRLMQFGLR